MAAGVCHSSVSVAAAGEGPLIANTAQVTNMYPVMAFCVVAPEDMGNMGGIMKQLD